MKIQVLGLGYIGLPTAVMFAKHGQQVVGIDVNPEIVEILNKGKIHIEEPELESELRKVVEAGNFKAALMPEKAEVFIISVPTPNMNNSLKSCDLSYVSAALDTVLETLTIGNTIIVESTIAPRTMVDFVLPKIENAGFKVGKDVYLVHCPERVLPGKIMEELIHNNRIIGGITESCTKQGKMIYRTFVKGELLETDASNAELSKLMENTYRDVNIALANELVKISTDLNSDALKVIELANKHPRVNIHTPGPGVGGHCLAVDPYFISAASPSNSPLIQEARKINSTMPYYIISIVEKIVKRENLEKITIFGATYKGNVDDIRESPALEIYSYLNQKLDIPVVLYDPHVDKDFIEHSLEKAIKGSELLLILVDHEEFKLISLDTLEAMKRKLVLDTRNIMINDIKSDIEYYNLGSLTSLI